MTEHTTHHISPVSIALAVLAPRYWLRWFIISVALMFGFFVSLERRTATTEFTTESGVRLTPLSWALGVAFVVYAFTGFIRCWRLTVKHSVEGTPAHDASLFQRVTGWNVAPDAPAEPLESPESHDSVLEVPTVLTDRKARQIEAHEGFDVVDRRRWSA